MGPGLSWRSGGFARNHGTRSAKKPRPFTAFGLRAEADLSGQALHVVATPIGNLGRYSFRALADARVGRRPLSREDTRVTKTLLAHYGIATPLVAYHEHNAAVMRPHLLARLAAGAALGFGFGCGHPLISDPGFNSSVMLSRKISMGGFGSGRVGRACRLGGGWPAHRPVFL